MNKLLPNPVCCNSYYNNNYHNNNYSNDRMQCLLQILRANYIELYRYRGLGCCHYVLTKEGDKALGGEDGDGR